jgi:glycosyltransferase-like protein
MSDHPRPLRVAILAHSTNPRGGVVHALELADGLTRLGHQAVVHAPDASGKGFFRAPLTPAVTVMATPAGRDVAEMVQVRIADYVRHFEQPANRAFDVFHAQDSISGNALATLKQRGLIPRFARTVHHIDRFTDTRLADWQTRAIAEADELFVVSRMWQQVLHDEFGRATTTVGNGVDTRRFTPARAAADAELAARHGIGGGPVYLAVGGVEARKNTLGIVAAFQQLLAVHPGAQLVIAGGASLLDHAATQHSFDALMRAHPALERAVLRIGPVHDVDMPALYRLADALVFPSLKEGFGLVVLEAMASGTPVVTSHIAPFTEYLGDNDVVWCDPHNVASIANAMMTVVTEPLRARLKRRGILLAHRHDWQYTAEAHLPIYRQLMELQHA